MIKTHELTHRFNHKTVIDSITLTIDDEFTIIAGPNGAGKTTFIRHFNGLLSPDEGRVTVNGCSVDTNPVSVRSSIGMVFQEPRNGFVAATVEADVSFGPENLGLPRNEIKRRVKRALAAVKLTGREEERIDQLSGGEQARVAIAGALAMEPDYLVLDEPLEGLDFPTRNAVLNHLTDVHDNGTGIIIVTHDLRDLIDLADRLIILDDGQIAADGTPDEIRNRLTDLGIRPPC